MSGDHGARLTDSARNMLYQMLRSGGQSGAAELGELLWGGAPSSHSTRYARPAGRVLNRLEALGLVRAWVRYGGRVWGITEAGRAALAGESAHASARCPCVDSPAECQARSSCPDDVFADELKEPTP